MKGVSGDPRKTAFLFQRVSVIVQRANAIALLLLLLCSHIDISEHSNCRLVPYWREFLGVSGSRTWSDTPFANTQV